MREISNSQLNNFANPVYKQAQTQNNDLSEIRQKTTLRDVYARLDRAQGGPFSTSHGASEKNRMSANNSVLSNR